MPDVPDQFSWRKGVSVIRMVPKLVVRHCICLLEAWSINSVTMLLGYLVVIRDGLKLRIFPSFEMRLCADCRTPFQVVLQESG